MVLRVTFSSMFSNILGICPLDLWKSRKDFRNLRNVREVEHKSLPTVGETSFNAIHFIKQTISFLLFFFLYFCSLLQTNKQERKESRGGRLSFMLIHPPLLMKYGNSLFLLRLLTVILRNCTAVLRIYTSSKRRLEQYLVLNLYNSKYSSRVEHVFVIFCS